MERLQPGPCVWPWMEPVQVRLLEEDALDFLDLSPASGPRLRSELPGTTGRSKAAWIVLEVWKVRTMFSLGPHFPSLQILKTLPVREVQRGGESSRADFWLCC